MTNERTQFLGGLRFGTHDLGLALGVRGGYTLDPGIYLGGLFDYFAGEDEEFVGGERSFSFWFLGADIGYDLGLAPSLVLRPLAGFGVGHSSIDCPESEACDRDDDELGIEIGALLLYSMGPVVLGPELRMLIVDETALVFGANVGVLF